MSVRMDFSEAKAEIKRRVNIVDFFEQRGYDLKRTGVRYVTLCPFHNEKTPSFSISETTNSWYCFGCQKHGDIFTFLMEKDGETFTEAVQEMADQLGITIARDDKAAERIRKRSELMDIVAETWNWFKSNYDALPENHIVKAHEIREKRGISSDNSDNHDLFGWAPEDRNALMNHLKIKGYKEDDMVEAGVINKSRKGDGYYCIWSGRLMFPICDVQGRPLGFSGRQVYDDKEGKVRGKYINSPENDLYHKRDLLFCQSIAREQSRKDHEIYVVEGQFDVIAMQHAGHENTVASSGTAITEQQAQSMRRMVGPEGRIIFMFDSDSAGQKAAERTFKTIGDAQGQAYASITRGKDPSDMLHDDGAAALREQVESHVEELWLHVLKNMIKKNKPSTSTGRRAFIKDFKPLWTSITDATVADSIIREASLLSGIPMTPLRSQIGDAKSVSNKPTRILIDKINDDGIESSDQVSRSLLATAYENPEARALLKGVRMNGIDEKFRRWLVAKDRSEAIPEETGDESIIKYAELLNDTMDRMHALEQASPVMTNLSSLFHQQVEVFLMNKKKQRIEDLLAENSAAGTSTDSTVLSEYDDKIRNSLNDIDDRFNKNLTKVSDMIDNRLGKPEDQPIVPTVYSTVDKDKLPPSEILKKNLKEAAEREATEDIDPNEPIMSMATRPFIEDDEPYYDPDDVPAEDEDLINPWG